MFMHKNSNNNIQGMVCGFYFINLTFYNESFSMYHSPKRIWMDMHYLLKHFSIVENLGWVNILIIINNTALCFMYSSLISEYLLQIDFSNGNYWVKEC